MDGSRSVTAGTAVVLALVAIALSLLVLLAPAPQSAGHAPTAIDLSLLITGEGSIGGPALTHLFHPQLMVVRRGDTVHLRLMNQSFYRHGIEITGYGIRSGPLAGGESRVLSFTATKAGLFLYRCYLPYDPRTATCAPDHDTMIGHLIVLEPTAR